MHLKCLMLLIGASISSASQASGDVRQPIPNTTKGLSAIVAPGAVEAMPRDSDIHVWPAPTSEMPIRLPSSGWYVVDSASPTKNDLATLSHAGEAAVNAGDSIPPPPPPPIIVSPPPPYIPPPAYIE